MSNKLVMQLAQPPDLKINDIGLFAILKSSILGERFGSIDNPAEWGKRTSYENDSEMSKRVWQSILQRHNQVLRKLEAAIMR